MDGSKALVSSSVKAFLMGWGMVFVYILFNCFGSLMLKDQVQKLGSWQFTSLKSTGSFFWALFSAWRAWAGLLSISIATGSWIMGLAHLELSKAYPVAIGCNLLIVLALSSFLFHETLTLSKIMGSVFIFTGMIFLFR